MKRVLSFAFPAAAAAILLFSGVSRMQAQVPAPAPSAKEPAEEERDPFAPEPAPALPPGMTADDQQEFREIVL